MHVLIACGCLLLLVVVIVLSVLWRRVRSGRQVADGRHTGYLTRFGKIEATLRPCPRVHLGQVPQQWNQLPKVWPAPTPGDDEVTPTLPSP